MKHDPMRQVIVRRLANMAKARRCGAKTRAGHPCQQAAVRGRRRCRMHGGAKGSGGPRGDRNGNFKHGLWTHEAKTIRRIMRAKVQELKALLEATGRPQRSAAPRLTYEDGGLERVFRAILTAPHWTGPL